MTPSTLPPFSANDFVCEPLDEVQHAIGLFKCGDDAMDKWLRERATPYVDENLTKVHVLRSSKDDDDGTVVGFFTLSATELQTSRIPKKKRFDSSHNATMNSSVYKHPALLLGKFAVHEEYQGTDVGSLLMLEVYKTFYHVGESIGARFLLVELREDLGKERLVKYYRDRFGFFELVDSSGQLTALARRSSDITLDLGRLDLV